MMIDNTAFLLTCCQSRRILVVAYVVLLWSSQQLKLLFGVQIIICTRSLAREPVSVPRIAPPLAAGTR